jgi:hypothetical protein
MLVVVVVIAVKVLQDPLQDKDCVIGFTVIEGTAVLDDTANVIVVIQELAVLSRPEIVYVLNPPGAEALIEVVPVVWPVVMLVHV